MAFYFGGTLFEKFVLQNRLDDFRALCHRYSCRYVEVSNGTIDLTNSEKGGYIRNWPANFQGHLRSRLEGPGALRELASQ